jgi:AcrR family transcriptional regulator
MDKQQEILKASLRLFVEFGFHGTPTSKIAKEAGVANGTLFHYYKTKDELIVALYSSVKTRLSEYMYAGTKPEAGFEENLKIIYANTLEWAIEHKEEFYFMQQFNTSPFLSLIAPEEISRQAKPHMELLESGIENKILKKLPVDLIFVLLSHHIYGMSQYIHNTQPKEAEKKKLISDSFNLLWRMLT